MVFIPSALVAVVLFSILDGVYCSCGHGTYLHRRITKTVKRQEIAAEQKVVEVGKFGYIGAQGPTQWAALAAENIGCATNTVQSPIDLSNKTATIIPGTSLALKFVDIASAEFENIGTTVEVVRVGKGSSTTVDGKVFDLKQFHFHTPSEHTIDGEYFPLEMHLVHEAIDAEIAVIAVQFQLSEGTETTELIKNLMEKIGEISTSGTVTESPALAFGGLATAINGQSLLAYTGSLTTPPCAEGLKFFVTTQQLPLDVATFNKVKSVVGFNARFTQNTAGSPNLLALSPAILAAAANSAAPVSEVVKAPTEVPAANSTNEANKTVTPAQSVSLAAPAATVSSIQLGSLSEASDIVKQLTGVDLEGIL